MLPVDIEGVTAEHITALVNENISERRTLEYKERLPGGSDDEKKEFLADVCSLANLTGGDVIYGIRDERDTNGRPTGVPESIIGLGNINTSVESERLESMIRDGIKPRVPNVRTRGVDIPGVGSVLILRIGRSWIKPHMVTYKGTSRFYSRHSTGKYQLDVQEIGRAFAEQRSLGEQLRDWRAGRIANILADDASIPLRGPAKLLMHFVPATALIGQQSIGLWPPNNNLSAILRPMGQWRESFRYNVDGMLAWNIDGRNHDYTSYVQVFRNGSLEYGDGYILNVGEQRGRSGEIPSKVFEERLVSAFGNAILVLNEMGTEDPIYLSCTLSGVTGYTLSRDGIAFYHDDVKHRFDRNIIQTSALEIDRKEAIPYRNSLLPLVNAIWQANGYEETPWLKNWGLDANRRPVSRE